MMSLFKVSAFPRAGGRADNRKATEITTSGRTPYTVSIRPDLRDEVGIGLGETSGSIPIIRSLGPQA